MKKYEKPDGTHWILASANSNWEWFGGVRFCQEGRRHAAEIGRLLLTIVGCTTKCQNIRRPMARTAYTATCRGAGDEKLSTVLEDRPRVEEGRGAFDEAVCDGRCKLAGHTSNHWVRDLSVHGSNCNLLPQADVHCYVHH